MDEYPSVGEKIVDEELCKFYESCEKRGLSTKEAISILKRWVSENYI